MLLDGSRRKRYVPAVMLLLLVLSDLLETVLNRYGLMPQRWESGRQILSMAEQLVFCLLPALFFLPLRHQRRGAKRDVMPLTLAAFAAGALLQLSLMPLGTYFTELGYSTGRDPALMDQTAWTLALGATVIAAPLFEEALYRGCLTAHLMDALRPVPCCIMSVLLFALAHGSWTGLPGHLLISLLCTLLMMYTGRVWGPVLAHMGFNVMAIAECYLESSPWMAAAGLLPLGVMGYMLCRMDWKPREGQAAPGKTETVLLAVLLIVTARRYFI